MHSTHSTPTARVVLNSAPLACALAWLGLLTSACGRESDPEDIPDPQDLPSDTDSSRTVGDDDATADPPDGRMPRSTAQPLDAGPVKTTSLDGAIAAAPSAPGRDGSTSTAAADGAPVSGPAGDAGAPPPPPPRASDAGGPDAAETGVPVASPPPAQDADLPPEVVAIAECGTELAGCLLSDLSQVPQCLEQFSTCGAVFSGDGGQQAACATRYATCVLSDPFNFARCELDLNGCEAPP